MKTLSPPENSGAIDLASVGSLVPDVSWTRQDGTETSLSSYRGSPVVLAFFSAEWDPAREYQLALFNQIFSTNQQKIELVRTASDSAEVHAFVDGEEQVNIPVLDSLDPEGRLAIGLGVKGRQALFLIDSDGHIAYKHVASYGNLPPADEMMSALAALPNRNVSRRQFLFTAIATLAASMLIPKVSALGLGGEASSKIGTTKTSFTLNINGQNHRVPSDNRITVLNALRDHLGMTGTKKGCDHGQCGACTIHMDGRRVNSCLLLAAQAEGSKLETIEGLANGEELHPVQQAFIEHDGFQCGYCTPGQIMSAVSCIQEGHTKSPEEIREWMSGNICRCGAYQGILEAVQEAAGRMAAK